MTDSHLATRVPAPKLGPVCTWPPPGALQSEARSQNHHARRIGELEQVLAGVATGCVLGDTESQRKWLDAEKTIEDARRFLRQHALAVPAYEVWARPSPSHVAKLAEKVSQLEVDLAEARSAAKQEIALDRAAH